MALARFAVVMLIALYLQAASGKSAFHAGMQVIPVAPGMAITSPIAGRLTRRYSARLLSSIGMAVTAIGLFALGMIIAPGIDSAALSACLLAVGVGTGLFMTPNTSSIMESVPANQRGMANGMRQGAQNAGYVTSTALSLAIVTMGLPLLEKKAAYAGTLSALSPHLLGTFTNGYRTALLVLAAACLVGMVASIARGPRVSQAGTAPERVPDSVSQSILAEARP